MRTKIIYDAKVIEIDQPWYELAHSDPLDSSRYLEDMEGCIHETHTIRNELIKARSFSKRLSNDEVDTVLIGFDERTCEALELLSTSELDEYETKFSYLEEKNYGLEDKLFRIKHASFWQRLKWLWKGIDA